MYEYEIINKVTDVKTFIWGYSWSDALRRNPKLDPNEWVYLRQEYID